MSNLVTVLLLHILIWNPCVLFQYGMDKYRARLGLWRVSERTLLLSAFALGGIGAMLGMLLFRHKTRHLRFRILVPLAFLLTGAALVGLIYFNQT